MPVIVENVLDLSTKLNDAGLQTSSFAGTVSSAAKVLDFDRGAGYDRAPLMRGEVVADVKAIEVDNSNEVCTLEWHLSNASNFGSGLVIVPLKRIGDTVATFESADTPLGQYRFPVSNEHGGNTYRYARLYGRIAGTIGTGFSVEAWFTHRS